MHKTTKELGLGNEKKAYLRPVTVRMWFFPSHISNGIEIVRSDCVEETRMM